MLDHEYNRVRQLPLNELRDPQHFEVLLEYAGEIAPPCIAEVLMRKLNEKELLPGRIPPQELDSLDGTLLPKDISITQIRELILTRQSNDCDLISS